MTAINWIKCSDRMPPDDDNGIILLANGYTTKVNGRACHELNRLLIMDDVYWIPYDEATWKALNHDV